MSSLEGNFNREIALILNSNDSKTDLRIKNGEIQKSSCFCRIFSKLSGKTETNDKEVRNRINQIAEHVVVKKSDGTINIAKTHEKLLNCVRSPNSTKNEIVVSVFLNKISKTYDSGTDQANAINQYKRENLKEALKNDTEYQISREIKNLLKADPNKDKSKILEAKTETKVLKMQKLYHMGEVGQTEKGATGTALVFDYRADGSKRLLGVFKPDAAYAPVSVRMGNMVRRLFGQHSLLSMKPYAQPTAENVSYKASQFFNFGGIPPSRLVTVNNVKGVFQLAAQTHVKTQEGDETRSTKSIKLEEAGALMKPGNNILNDPKREFKPSEVEAFQRFILHDFLIGNLDAHEENWFIKLGPNDEITQIVGIDKANSFPVKNPGALGLGGANQYKWKNIPIANKPFTEDMKALMRDITPEKVNQFLEQIENDNKGFLTPQMSNLFKQRANVMREVADMEGITPGDLAKMITDNDFKMGAKKKISSEH